MFFLTRILNSKVYQKYKAKYLKECYMLFKELLISDLTADIQKIVATDRIQIGSPFKSDLDGSTFNSIRLQGSDFMRNELESTLLCS